MDKTTLDPEILKTQDKLTPEQEEAIQQNAIKEFNGGGDADEKEDEAELAPEKDTEEGEGDKEEESKDAEEEKEPEAEKDGKEDEKKSDEPTPEAKAEAEKLAKEAFEKDVLIYMDENSMSEQQARDELEHIGKIQEKYGKDPVKMGKTLLHLQRAYGESQEKLKQLSDVPKEGQIVWNGKTLSMEESREKLIEMYRGAYPKITEDLDDEKIHELAVTEYKKEYARFVEKQKTEVATKAVAKREELLATLREEDKPFLKDIKAILDRTEDSEVFAKDFDFSDYVYWARGRNFHKVLKEREDAAYKRGLEQKKILGAKPDGSNTEPKGSPKPGKSVSLSESDKTRALAMYQSLEITDVEKFKMYQEFKNGG